MRYREGATPDAAQPYGDGMHAMLTLSASIGIVFGLVMFALSRRGRGSLWLACWSVGLTLSGVAYLVADGFGWKIARL